MLAGLAAALIDSMPGFPIGPGGRPAFVRVLYGDARASSDCFRGSVQLPVAKRIVASMPSGIPALSRL